MDAGYSVLFLDFDGVVARAIPGASAHARIVPEWVARLSWIVERTACRVVVSSTWRQNPQTREGFTVSQLTAALRARGFTGSVFDVTPMHEDVSYADDIARVRGAEILAWCRAQTQEPRSIAVLDDVALTGAIAPYVVQTNEHVGLTEAEAKRAVKLLMRPIRGRKPWALAPSATRARPRSVPSRSVPVQPRLVQVPLFPGFQGLAPNVSRD